MYTKEGFKKAVDRGDGAKVEKYIAHLSKSPKTLEEFLNLTRWGRSMVYCAVSEDHSEVLDTLLTAGAPIKKREIEHSMRYSQMKNLSIFLKHDIDVQASLEYTIINDYKASMLFLLRNAAERIDLDAALGYALECKYTLAKKIAAHGADVNAESPNKIQLAHLAAENEDASFFAFLIEKNADLNAQNSAGDTPLHIAIEKGHMGVIRLLMAQGVRTDILNNRGYTAATLAQTKNIPLFENEPPVKTDTAQDQRLEGTWQPLNAWEIARVAPQPALNQTIIEIFNFETSERRPILEDTRTGTKTPGISELFSKISTAAVERARTEHKKHGGKEKPYAAAVFIGKKTG